ncbi:MAG: type II toxin-antitoxin system PemK/MazF family toxin [Candidatus Pacearchaeota archaeon]
MKLFDVERGDIFLVNLEPIRGHEQGGVRPCLIIQNDEGNRHSPLTIIAPLTSKLFSREFATNVFISKQDSNLDKDSTIMFNQIRTIDKRKITKKISSLNYNLMGKVDMAIKISLGLDF